MMRWGLLTLIIAWLLPALAQAQTVCPEPKPNAKQRYATVDLNLRDFPGSLGDVLVTLPKGEKVFPYREYEGWSRVNVASINVTGWVATKYLSQECVEGGGLNREKLPRAQIVDLLLTQSQNSYSGSCPCPYNTDRAGRSCGRRSAYSRPGGQSPLCYASDVDKTMIDRFRGSR